MDRIRLDDGAPDPREAFRQARAELGAPDPREALRQVRATGETRLSVALGTSISELSRLCEHVDDLLQHESERIREAGFYLICLYPDKCEVELHRLMTAALEDPSERVRGAAISALGTRNVAEPDVNACHLLKETALNVQNPLALRVASLSYLVLAHNTMAGLTGILVLQLEEMEALVTGERSGLTELLDEALEGVEQGKRDQKGEKGT
jgi:hypothetical protein